MLQHSWDTASRHRGCVAVGFSASMRSDVAIRPSGHSRAVCPSLPDCYKRTSYVDPSSGSGSSPVSMQPGCITGCNHNGQLCWAEHGAYLGADSLLDCDIDACCRSDFAWGAKQGWRICWQQCSPESGWQPPCCSNHLLSRGMATLLRTYGESVTTASSQLPCFMHGCRHVSHQHRAKHPVPSPAAAAGRATSLLQHIPWVVPGNALYEQLCAHALTNSKELTVRPAYGSPHRPPWTEARLLKCINPAEVVAMALRRHSNQVAGMIAGATLQKGCYQKVGARGPHRVTGETTHVWPHLQADKTEKWVHPITSEKTDSGPAWAAQLHSLQFGATDGEGSPWHPLL
jgi:hypothetical protein